MSEIAILYAHSRMEGLAVSLPESLLEAVEARGVMARWVARDATSKRYFDITTDSVCISTIHSAKGQMCIRDRVEAGHQHTADLFVHPRQVPSLMGQDERLAAAGRPDDELLPGAHAACQIFLLAVQSTDGLVPVSYTHLDVYKRQPQGEMLDGQHGQQGLVHRADTERSEQGTPGGIEPAGISLDPGSGGTDQSLELVLKPGIAVDELSRYGLRTDAVSYTHLSSAASSPQVSFRCAYSRSSWPTDSSISPPLVQTGFSKALTSCTGWPFSRTTDVYKRQGLELMRGCIPHARGDEPYSASLSFSVMMYSPRTWG